MDLLTNKTVLITGGTGTFGQAFTKNILENHKDVRKVVIYSRDEYKQFKMSNLPWCKKYSKKIRFFIGDVRDKKRLYRAFNEIDIVVHAAALKQVPSCEYNPFEAIKTNINGAQNVIDAAIDNNVSKVVSLSTDKACAPVNLYGATKLCSDKLFIAGNAYVGDRDVHFSVVRYGNVIGSRGSVLPYFKQKAKDKEKEIPVTNQEMTRFWLRIEDAIELVLTALRTMKGGEIFVKKTPSIKIMDLAKAIAPKIPIKIVGVRPGEKIHEILISNEDARNTIEFKDYYIIKPEFGFKKISSKLGKSVNNQFEYHSGNNPKQLSIAQIKKLLN
jgi:UDP-N-acetylglucosamine 4,6-dehydratase/5-epimerase